MFSVSLRERVWVRAQAQHIARHAAHSTPCYNFLKVNVRQVLKTVWLFCHGYFDIGAGNIAENPGNGPVFTAGAAGLCPACRRIALPDRSKIQPVLRRGWAFGRTWCIACPRREGRVWRNFLHGVSMKIPPRLLDGYRRFKETHLTEKAAFYRNLAKGQNPGVMMIACADSRVDPSAIFDAGPGELFVVRNVANMVPPYETGGGYHGTSAAIEFAVEHLKVQDIVVMGHGLCGGIAASLSEKPVGQFIAPWVDMISSTRDAVLANNPNADAATLQQALEFGAIGHSLQNLQSFPFVQAALDAGRIRLHGAWFSIASGELRWLSHNNQFEKIP